MSLPELDGKKVSEPFGAQRVPAIDGLRGVAALMILFVHCTFSMGGSYYFPLVQPYFYASRMGVPLFFVISAFCIYGTYSSLMARNPHTAPFEFWIKRTTRIVPLWWFWLAVYTYLHAEPLRQTLASAFFYWGFKRYGPYYDVFPGGWSLFVEETFYWLFPLIFPLLQTTRRTLLAAGIFTLASILWLNYGELLGVPNTNDYLYYSPINNWFCFFLGMWCYQVLADPQKRSMLADWGRRYGGIAMLLIATGWLEWCCTSHRSTALLFAVVVLIACSGKNSVSRVLSWGPLRWVGRHCYSLYLCHFYVLDFWPQKTILPWSQKLRLPAFIELRLLIWFPVIVAAVSVISVITFTLFETPSMRLGQWLCAKLKASFSAKYLAEASQKP